MIAIPNMEKPKSCKECMNNCINIPLECYSEDDTMPDCTLIEIVTCGECKHKPIKYDPEGDDFGFNLVSPNGYDNLCPCLNTDDGFYSYMPDDNFFCAFGERRADGDI